MLDYWHKYIIEKSTRDYILSVYPKLNENPAYWRLLQYFLVNPVRDENTGYIIISYMTCAIIEGKTSQAQKHNYTSGDFLSAFSKDICSLGEWQKYEYLTNTARTCLPEIDLSIQTYLDLDTVSTVKTNPVYFDSGKPYTDYSKRKDNEELKHSTTQYMQTLEKSQSNYEILEYLNNLPANVFSSIGDFTSARNSINEILDENKRNYNNKILATLESNPKVIKYQGSKNSQRVFTGNLSILQSPKAIRKAFYSNCREYDLTNAQVAIIASQYSLSHITKCLENDNTIWKSLEKESNLNLQNVNIKVAVKTAIYTTVFGGGKSSALKSLIAITDVATADSLYGTEVFLELVKAKSQALQQITLDGGAFDCFSNWIAHEKVQVSKNGKITKKWNTKSIFAQLAQALEVKIMLPVIQLAKTTKDFVIVGWLHDSIIVHYTDKSKADYWEKKILNCNTEILKELNIKTRLQLQN